MCHGSQQYLHVTQPLLNLEDCVQDNDKWAIRSIHYTKNGKNIAQALIQGNAVAICDGSYKDHFGTAGFVIQRWNSKVLCITGAHITPGHPEEINPYPSKLGGIVLAVVIVTGTLATSLDRWSLRLLPCSGGNSFNFSAWCMTSRPSLLLLVLNWDDMRTIVHSLWTSIILSFFLSCTAVMLTHPWGTKLC
jgi:hypothetical protein